MLAMHCICVLCGIDRVMQRSTFIQMAANVIFSCNGCHARRKKNPNVCIVNRHEDWCSPSEITSE